MAAAAVIRSLLSDSVLGHHILPHFLFFSFFSGSVSCRICLALPVHQYECNTVRLCFKFSTKQQTNSSNNMVKCHILLRFGVLSHTQKILAC